jgi:hypothetical protein
MTVNKEHRQCHTLDMGVGWETPRREIVQKVLSGELCFPARTMDRSSRRVAACYWKCVTSTVGSLRGVVTLAPA